MKLPLLIISLFLFSTNANSAVRPSGSSSIGFANTYGEGFKASQFDKAGNAKFQTYRRTEVVPNTVEDFADTGIRYWKVEYDHNNMSQYTDYEFEVQGLDTYGNVTYEGKGEFDVAPGYEVDIEMEHFEAESNANDLFSDLYISEKDLQTGTENTLGDAARVAVNKKQAEQQLESIFTDFIREHRPDAKEELGSTNVW